MDALSDAARNSYLYARAVVGREAVFARKSNLPRCNNDVSGKPTALLTGYCSVL